MCQDGLPHRSRLLTWSLELDRHVNLPNAVAGLVQHLQVALERAVCHPIHDVHLHREPNHHGENFRNGNDERQDSACGWRSTLGSLVVPKSEGTECKRGSCRGKVDPRKGRRTLPVRLRHE